MRALTVRQPWAGAIIHRGKGVENRTRNIAGSYRGPVAIHAGKTLDVDAFDDPLIGEGTVRGVVQMIADDLDPYPLGAFVAARAHQAQLHAARLAVTDGP